MLELPDTIAAYQSTKVTNMDLLFHTKGYCITANGNYFISLSAGTGIEVSESLWAEILKAYTDFDGSPKTASEIGKRHGVDTKTIKKIFAHMATTHDSPPIPYERLKDMTILEVREELVELRYFIASHQAEASVLADNERDALKWRTLQDLGQAIEGRMGALASAKPKEFVVPSESKSGQYDLFFGLTDGHYGMYSSDKGNEWNRQLARRTFLRAMDDILARAPGNPRRIIIPLGSDNMHIDNFELATTKGTVQSCDGTYREMVAGFFDLMVTLVEKARPHCKEVVLMPMLGNHDRTVGFQLCLYLQAYFRECDDVRVADFDPKSYRDRSYLKVFGTLLQCVHSDIGKPADYAAWARTDVRSLYSKCERTLTVAGHIHTARSFPTFTDALYVSLPTLCAQEDWHQQQGYCSTRAIKGLCIDKYGLSAEIITTWARMKRLLR